VEVRHERETRERAQARAHGKRDWRLPRIDAEEPRLTLRPGSDASDLLPAIDTSPRVRDQFASATFGKVVTGPVHARRRVAKPAPADGGLPFASGASRKPPRLPIVVVLVAVLAASVTWYANRPEVAPFVVALRMQAREILAQLEHEWQARKGQQAEPERKGDEAARLAEEQLKSDEVLTAERTRQSTMARQKEEAARAAAQNYQRAMTLLNQGRSSEAVRLLRQLAHGGHGAAAKTLGDLYSSGEEVLLDRQEASHFYAIAERNGVKVDRSMPSIRR
jgi:hypothetical protein